MGLRAKTKKIVEKIRFARTPTLDALELALVVFWRVGAKVCVGHCGFDGYQGILYFSPGGNGIGRTMLHIEDDVLESYVMGTLSQPNVEKAEEHLFACETCKDRLDDIDAWVGAICAAAVEFRQGRVGTARVRTAGAERCDQP